MASSACEQQSMRPWSSWMIEPMCRNRQRFFFQSNVRYRTLQFMLPVNSSQNTGPDIARVQSDE